MKNVAFIFARGGSKGLPNKNILNFCGKPLISYAISSALNSDLIDECYVSTDSLEIANISSGFGAKIIIRPRELAEDHSPEWLAWQHAIKYVQKNFGDFDKFISLPTTSPLRIDEDITNSIEKLTDDCDFVVTFTDTNRSPWFNMVKLDENSKISPLITGETFFRRQDTPLSYDLTTVAYVSKPNFILENNSIWDGEVVGQKIPLVRAIDIDTKHDFEIAEFLYQKRLQK